MFDIKSFYEAKDMADAINALIKNPGAETVSGGIDVLIHIKEGKDVERSVASIHDIEALEGVRLLNDGNLWIDADTIFSHTTNDVLVQKYIPMLGDAVDMVGGPQIRNTGTTGGDICNGATPAGPTSTMWVLEAGVPLEGPEGKRRVPVYEFYTDPGRTVRDRIKVYTGLLVYRDSFEGWSGHYTRHGKRKATEIATLGYAMRVKLSQDKERIKDVRLGYGVADPTPPRCRKTEDDLKGRVVNSSEAVLAFGKAALGEVNPRSSWRASEGLRLQPVEGLSRRTLAEAIKKIGGAINA